MRGEDLWSLFLLALVVGGFTALGGWEGFLVALVLVGFAGAVASGLMWLAYRDPAFRAMLEWEAAQDEVNGLRAAAGWRRAASEARAEARMLRGEVNQ